MAATGRSTAGARAGWPPCSARPTPSSLPPESFPLVCGKVARAARAGGGPTRGGGHGARRPRRGGAAAGGARARPAAVGQDVVARGAERAVGVGTGAVHVDEARRAGGDRRRPAGAGALLAVRPDGDGGAARG